MPRCGLRSCTAVRHRLIAHDRNPLVVRRDLPGMNKEDIAVDVTPQGRTP